jgi:predicted cupin superfamily sugar epimerase
MNDRAKALIEALQLFPHPEGGFYREIFRSSSVVFPRDARGDRSAVTTIYFLLVSGSCSRWHKVISDELWIHLEGSPVKLWSLDWPERLISSSMLGPLDEHSAPIRTIPAGAWQAAEISGEYALAACIVAPGFEFEDFELIQAGSEQDRWLRQNGRGATCL